MPIDQGILDAVASSNLKVVADSPAVALALVGSQAQIAHANLVRAQQLAQANANSAQQNMNTIAAAALQGQLTLQSNSLANVIAMQNVITGKITELLATTDVAETAGLGPLAQILTKAAQTTPPVSSPGPVTG